MLDFAEDNNKNTTANNKADSRPATATSLHGGIDFGDNEEQKSIIKVIGVGGGGGNAVNHMYREGIHDVSFAVCNLDNQALNDSPVPVHLLLGTEGLGAGNKPEKGRQEAENSIEDIRRLLDDGTKMVFITAGMGGGTGTGAAPVIARVSKEMGILTVGIVTIPFRWEGNKKIDQALDGVEEMSKYVDALLVINNERLFEICSDMGFSESLAKADNILCVAAKSIAEIITMRGKINLDFNDVKTVIKDGGIAIISTGYGEGEERVKRAIEDALDSPLLNNNDILNSKKILINISFGSEKRESGGLLMEEMYYISDFTNKLTEEFETKWGVAIDPDLGNKVKVTILATGFGVEKVLNMNGHVSKIDEEERRKKAEQEEIEATRASRRRTYYGLDDKQKKIKRSPNILYFRLDDLDNDDIISAVESTPTYKRTSLELKEIRNQASSSGKGTAGSDKPDPEEN